MPSVTGFNITYAALAYSQISGILAGFVFAILILLIERQIHIKQESSDGNDFTRQAIVFLAVAFLANVIVAVLWALVSGETKTEENRPTVLSLFAMLNFGLAAPLTIEAIIFVIASARIRRVIPIFRWIFFVSVTISVFYLWVTTTNLLVIQERSKILITLQANSWFFILLCFLTISPLFTGWLINKSATKTRSVPNQEKIFNRFILIWLGGILFSTVGFGIVAVLEPCRSLPMWLMLVMNLFWAILLGWAIYFLPFEPQYLTISNHDEPSEKREGSGSTTNPVALSLDEGTIGFLLGYFYSKEKDD